MKGPAGYSRLLPDLSRNRDCGTHWGHFGVTRPQRWKDPRGGPFAPRDRRERAWYAGLNCWVSNIWASGYWGLSYSRFRRFRIW